MLPCFLCELAVSANLDNHSNVCYEGQAFVVTETSEIGRWLLALRDRRASAKIVDRIKRAANGNFGDVKSASGGVSELRIDYGPGYRVYFIRRGNELVILLCGGDKRTQRGDIATAKQLKAEIERRNGHKTV